MNKVTIRVRPVTVRALTINGYIGCYEGRTQTKITYVPKYRNLGSSGKVNFDARKQCVKIKIKFQNLTLKYDWKTATSRETYLYKIVRKIRGAKIS